ncbi:Arf3-interacting protein 1, N-terminal domain [Phytophthora cinnamomi]|uniref:Arf3-interacting protein 1, N-terminal domain n=1 Tax=Phytophthora cinnamomi TaxID=4785 RepID=UPI00355A5778|nr:Arf3-interacting protein 1, N-terminal domain [Phytophthora cinnamomi]
MEPKIGERRPLAEVVLYAEFDLTKGSTLRASYPHAFAHYSPEFFADIMLPEGVHNREEDATVFFLNRQNAPSDSDSQSQLEDPLQSFMYCLSVVRTTHDTAARRGAKVTAVALCSTHKSCFALKDVLDVAVRKIVGAPGEAESEAVLRELHGVVNRVDVSGLRGLSAMERRLMKRTISSTGRAAADHEDAERLEKALFFRTQALWDDLPIPLQFKICSTDDQHDDGTLTQLLQTFGDQAMTLFNAVLTGQRVIMLGYNRPAGEVCNFVLATSSLVCPPLFGLIHRQYPYANLTDLGFLSTPGYIAGVTNPMFKTKREWWDVLCDISTGEVFVSAPVEKEDYDASDRNFVLEVLDGVAAGYDEEWVRCMFEEYTRKNIVDIALGEANYLSPDALAKRSAVNNKRITKWAQKTGVDLKRHIRSLQGDMVVLDDTLVEKIYSDFATLLNTELELQEFLSFLPVLRGGLQTIAQGIFHPSISVKHNTVVLLKRLEEFPSTASSMRRLNAFLLMSYQRIHDVVKPDTRTT